MLGSKRQTGLTSCCGPGLEARGCVFSTKGLGVRIMGSKSQWLQQGGPVWETKNTCSFLAWLCPTFRVWMNPQHDGSCSQEQEVVHSWAWSPYPIRFVPYKIDPREIHVPSVTGVLASSRPLLWARNQLSPDPNPLGPWSWTCHLPELGEKLSVTSKSPSVWQFCCGRPLQVTLFPQHCSISLERTLEWKVS